MFHFSIVTHCLAVSHLQGMSLNQIKSLPDAPTFSALHRWWRSQPWCITSIQLKKSLEGLQHKQIVAVLFLLGSYEREITRLTTQKNAVRHQCASSDDCYCCACACALCSLQGPKYVTCIVKRLRENIVFLEGMLQDILAHPNDPEWNLSNLSVTFLFNPDINIRGNIVCRLDPFVLLKCGVQRMCPFPDFCWYGISCALGCYMDEHLEDTLLRDRYEYKNALKWADFIVGQQLPNIARQNGTTGANIYRHWHRAVNEKRKRVAEIVSPFLPKDICNFVLLPYCSF